MSVLRTGIIVLIALAAALTGARAPGAAPRLLQGGFMGLNIDTAMPATTTAFRNDDAPAFAGSLGFRLTPQWRIAGEVSHSLAGLGDAGGERQSRLALVNLYYDIDTGSSRLKPFLTLGAGVASHDIYRGGASGLGLATETLSGMAWQAGAGLSYQINDDLSLSGGYRHIGGAAIDDGNGQIAPGGHEFRIGIKYKIPVQKPAAYDLERSSGDR